MLLRVVGLQEEGGSATFADLTPGTWYYRVVATAANHGLVKGYNAEQFGPHDQVTREQVATMLTRVLQQKEIPAALSEGQISELLERFKDTKEISAWAKAAAAEAVKQGLVSGYPDRTFKPQNTATRAEVAAMLKRLLEIKLWPK